MTNISNLQNEIIACRKCPRLVAWREKIAREKVSRFAHETYWGRPVPSFGDPNARFLIVGLAPAAHGGNRTGRIFTGDRSGDLLYEMLYKFNFASQPHSVSRDDGLVLRDCYITAALHCAPPQNKPTAEEQSNCFPYLLRELHLLLQVRVILALGKIAFDTILNACKQAGRAEFSTRPRFAHGLEMRLNHRLTLLASYHPSQQNTFTGKLTPRMFEAVFKQVRELLESVD
jgi:uracil-DNA glycosylase family 4